MPSASASGRSGQPASFSAASVADSSSLRPEERSSRSSAAMRSGSRPAAAPARQAPRGVAPGQHSVHVLAQAVRHHLGHRAALAGQARPQLLPLLLVQPEGQQQAPRPVAVLAHPAAAVTPARAAAAARAAAPGPGPSAGTPSWAAPAPLAVTVCSAATRSR